MDQRHRDSLSLGWVLASFGGLLPLLGLLRYDVWYSVGWGALGWPLILVGATLGMAASIVVMVRGSWQQRLFVLLPFLQYLALFASPLF